MRSSRRTSQSRELFNITRTSADILAALDLFNQQQIRYVGGQLIAAHAALGGGLDAIFRGNVADWAKSTTDTWGAVLDLATWVCEKFPPDTNDVCAIAMRAYLTDRETPFILFQESDEEETRRATAARLQQYDEAWAKLVTAVKSPISVSLAGL